MDPHEFFSLAEFLSKENEPAKKRTAISRAYYAAYLVTREFLLSIGIKVKKSSNGHGETTKCIGASDDIAISKVGSKLGDLQGMRNKADYDMDLPSVEKSSVAITQVAIAKSIIKEIDDCSINPERKAAITPKIMQYYKSWINPL